MKSTQDTGPMPGTEFSRTSYDLSHWNFMTGRIGSLQTLACVPVVAGDSMSLDMRSVFRLSQLRRNLYLDCVVDLFAFYVPHRHIYGDDWNTFIKSGIDEAVTFGTDTLVSGTQLNCVGLRTDTSGVLPRWLTRGPIQIWNRYFRDPNDTSGILSEDYFTTLDIGNVADDYILRNGLKTAHLKALWNTTMTTGLTTADYRVALTDTNTTLDLTDLSAMKGRLRTEQAREYYALERYNDILKGIWRGGANIDADKRPELLMRSTQWLSGYDVDGTDASSLGSYSGKAQALCQLSFPRKFFPEHGTMWVMGVLRFPPVHAFETHYLAKKSQPTYSEIAGDPDVVARTKPTAYNLTNIMVNASSVALGDQPHSQYYRMHPNTVHQTYVDGGISGHPFIDHYPASKVAATYISPTEYDDIFQSLMLGHWNSQSNISIKAQRFIPDPQRSIFAGTN